MRARIARRAWPLAVVLVSLGSLSGCATGFPGTGPLTRADEIDLRMERMFDDLAGASTASDLDSDTFAPPSGIRPCCAFGFDLGVKLGAVPVPGVRLANVVEVGEIGRHIFDPGVLAIATDTEGGFLSTETNGLVYTCRGGFVDVAHVRDYADWTAFLASRMEELFATGGVIELPEEAGARFVYVSALAEPLLDRVGRREAAVELAQWVAFQLSLWHETATWFGWAAFSGFPELASAFSPEDLYSNMVGIQMAGAIIRAGGADTPLQYSRNMDFALEAVLRRLGALPRQGTREAAAAVDGLWWDSSRRLPEREVVIRRNFEGGPLLVPWRVPRRLQSAALRESMRRHCVDEAAAQLTRRQYIEGVPLHDLVRLDVRIEPQVAERIAGSATDARWLSDRGFAAAIARVRRENAEIFGERADRPD